MCEYMLLTVVEVLSASAKATYAGAHCDAHQRTGELSFDPFACFASTRGRPILIREPRKNLHDQASQPNTTVVLSPLSPLVKCIVATGVSIRT